MKAFKFWTRQNIADKFGLDIESNCASLRGIANRKLSGEIDGETVSGEIDLMLASGQFEPKKPYFCLHEYKKEKGVDNDPLGQLIIAMMTAQELNQDSKVIFGAYVAGRNWFFLTLKDRKYCISEEYVATREDIIDIFKILQNLKRLIAR